MTIEIIREKISKDQLLSHLNNPFPDMVKFVVDLERGILALGGEMHADEEQVLLEDGSEQKNVWGGNVYPLKQKDDRVEYESLINIRPAQDNRSLEVQDQSIKDQIKEIVQTLLPL